MPFWSAVTRLGEAQILLPLMLVVALWCLRERASRPGAWTWMLATAAAALLVTASKVAFIGFGWGLQEWDFTGLSGHAMFATAVLPVLGALVLRGEGGVSRVGAAAGAGLALLVSVSRVVVGAHSASEVVLGAVVGFAAAVPAVLAFGRHGAGGRHLVRGAGAMALTWLAATSMAAPPSRTHDWVTRLSLAASGRTQPFTRPMRGQVLPFASPEVAPKAKGKT